MLTYSGDFPSTQGGGRVVSLKLSSAVGNTGQSAGILLRLASFQSLW